MDEMDLIKNNCELGANSYKQKNSVPKSDEI